MENGQSVFFLSPHTPYGRVRLARFALKTLTPRFTDFFTDFEKKTDCFAVYVSCLLCSYPGGAEQRFLQHKFLSDAYQPESDAENENTYEHRLLI